MTHPSTTPLIEWSSAWLKLECGSIMGNPAFLIMTDNEKSKLGMPITDAEMREYILEHRP